jgi:hypothetical protein
MSFKDYLPSQTFRKRLLSIVIIVLIITAIVFGFKLIAKGIQDYKINKQIKKLPIELQAEAKTITLGELQTKDSNNNGIPDWQERIFGLDPLADGNTNKDIILKKQAELKSENPDLSNSIVDPNNETTKFAQDFITMVMSLEGSNALTEDALNNISNAASNDLSDYTLPDFISAWNLKTVDNSVIFRDKYVNSVLNEMATLSKNNGNDELAIIASALSQKTDADIILSPLVVNYQMSAKNLKDVYVPKEFGDEHLAIVNSLAHIATSLENMKYSNTDPARATKGINQYQAYSESLNVAIKNIQAKF